MAVITISVKAEDVDADDVAKSLFYNYYNNEIVLDLVIITIDNKPIKVDEKFIQEIIKIHER